ncbi:MAG TPA: beta-phosphoglucomutase [Candidatus Gastranaerophilales bacterium]|nr:beta-phosphoglucomutase [Candidatus Gastranaerophilales bacterium]
MKFALKNIKAIIFDLDGVITDTSDLHTKAWKKMADEEKIPFDNETSEKLRGVSRQKSLEIILEDAKNKYGFTKTFTDEQFKELMERKNNYYVENLYFITPKNLLEGAKDVIDFFKSRGYKVAVGSSSKNARLVLKKLEIENYFDVVIDGTEIVYSKPHPEIFQKVADKLGISCEKCAVVEDAASGIESANTAGMVSIGIGQEDRFKKENQITKLRFDNMKDFLIYLYDISLPK